MCIVQPTCQLFKKCLNKKTYSKNKRKEKAKKKMKKMEKKLQQ